MVGHVYGELEIGGEDLLVDFEGVFSILSKGHIASKKLIKNDAEGPEIDIIGVALAGKYLRGHIGGSANDGESFMQGFRIKLFTCAQINNLQVPIFGHHDILRFEVTIDNHARVNGFEDLDHDGGVEPGLFEAQQADQPNSVEQLEAVDVLHEEVDVEWVLEGADVVDHEGR